MGRSTPEVIQHEISLIRTHHSPLTTHHNGTGRTLSRSRRPLRLITYLAPNLFWFYQFVSRHLAKKLRYPTEISVGSDYAQLRERADIAFICGLPYVEHTLPGDPHFEPLVAPVLMGDRL